MEYIRGGTQLIMGADEVLLPSDVTLSLLINFLKRMFIDFLF